MANRPCSEAVELANELLPHEDLGRRVRNRMQARSRPYITRRLCQLRSTADRASRAA